MKKLIALIAILGFGPGAYAADGADATHSGEFRLRYTNNIEADYDDQSAGAGNDQDVEQRLRWGTTVRAGEKVTANFTLVHNSDWGSNPDQVPDSVSVPAGTDAAGGDAGTNNLLIVNEAYMNWMATDEWAIRAGRGAFTMADGRFVSANDYDDVLRAFDGVMAMYDHEFARFGFFYVTGAKSTDAAETNDFGRFFGVSADFKSLPEVIKTAHLHLVQVKRDNGTYAGLGRLGKQDNMKAGLTVAGATSGVDFRVNYEMEDGENTAEADGSKTDISTSMIDAEVGYTMANMMNMRFHVGYHTDSGTDGNTTDDETYDGFHYDRHNNAGMMDILGWGNLTYTRVGFSLAPTDDVSVGAEYLMFERTEADGTNYGYAGETGGALTGATEEDDDLGAELDIWVTKKYANNFNITASYRTFAPGDAFGSDADDRTQYFVESKLTF